MREIAAYDVIQIKSRQDDQWDDLMTLRTPAEIAEAKSAVRTGWTGACGRGEYRIRAGSWIGDVGDGILYTNTRERGTAPAPTVEETVELVACLLDGKTPEGWKTITPEMIDACSAEEGDPDEWGIDARMAEEAAEVLRSRLIDYIQTATKDEIIEAGTALGFSLQR